MSNLVPIADIERIVGVPRHPTLHYGRAAANEVFYVLHSQKCLDSGIDLRECSFSVALDQGISIGYNGAPWRGFEDRPVVLAIWRKRLIPRVD